MIFSKGDLNSIFALLEGFYEFSKLSGLVPNAEKLQCFFCIINSEVHDSIINLIKFFSASLPITYIGIRLITGRLNINNYMPIISKIRSRVEIWISRFLNFNGRLLLIEVVLTGLLGY